MAEGITGTVVARKVETVKIIDALSLRTSERLELSNTTPLMVTSWGDECDGAGPDGGRTVVDELELAVGLVLETCGRAYTFDVEGLYEGLT